MRNMACPQLARPYQSLNICSAMNRFMILNIIQFDNCYLGLSSGSNVTIKTRDLQQEGSTKLQGQDFPRGYVPKISSISRVSLAWPLTHALSRRSCKRSNTSDITAISTCQDVFLQVVLSTVAVAINCDSKIGKKCGRGRTSCSCTIDWQHHQAFTMAIY